MDFFKSIDIYGKRVGFTFNNKEKFRSSIGGAVSLITVIIFILFVFVLGNDFFHRLNPKIQTYIDVEKNFSNIPLSRQTFNLAYRIKNINDPSKKADNYIFGYLAYLNSSNGVEIQASDCTPENSPDLFGFKGNKSNEFKCFDFSKAKLTLNSEDTLLVFALMSCPTKASCKDEKEVSSYMKNYSDWQVTIYYPQTVLGKSSGNDEAESIYNFYEGKSSILSDMKTNIKIISFQKVELRDDYGLIGKDISITKKLSYYQEEYNQEISNVYTVYGRNLFYLRARNQVYFRTFIKLQEFLANLGSVMGVVYTVCKFCVSMMNVYEKKLFICNNLFEYNSETNKTFMTKLKLNNNNHSDIELKAMSDQDQNQINLNFQGNPTIPKPKASRVNFPLCLFIRNRLGCVNKYSDKNKEIFHVVNNVIDQRLDFLDYLRNVNIIKVMRQIFFNNEQSLSFEFLRKENVADPDTFNKLSQEKEKMKIDVIDYFKSRFKEKTLSEKDEKIISFLEIDLLDRIIQE